jgi:hypothetical protein
MSNVQKSITVVGHGYPNHSKIHTSSTGLLHEFWYAYAAEGHPKLIFSISIITNSNVVNAWTFEVEATLVSLLNCSNDSNQW